MCCFNLITVTYYFGSATPRPGTETLPRWLSARDDTCVSSLPSQFFSFILLQRFHFLLFYTLTYSLSPSLSLSITISLFWYLMHTYPLKICFVPALISDLRNVLFHSKGNEKRYFSSTLWVKDFANRFFQHLFMLFSAKAGFLFHCHWRQKQLTQH